MDLEARVQGLLTALRDGAPQPFLADRLLWDLEGRRGDSTALLSWLATAPKANVQGTVVGVKRNLTFVDWAWPGVGDGVAVLSWDQDGRVVHALVQKRART